MKPSNLIIVIIAVILVNLCYSQNKKTEHFQKMYFKAGIDFSNFSNTSHFKYDEGGDPRGGVNLLSLAVAGHYNNRLQFEAQYKYLPLFSYNRDEIRAGNPKTYEEFIYSGSGSLTSSYINLRANYFVNDNRREDPIYFIWTVSLGIQKVSETEQYVYQTRTDIINKNFTRFVIGPEAGFGIFFELGYFNFQTEFTFTARSAFFGQDIKYSENSVNFSISPVINF